MQIPRFQCMEARRIKVKFFRSGSSDTGCSGQAYAWGIGACAQGATLGMSSGIET